MFIDTHCHLDHPSLLERLPEALQAAGRMKVLKYIVPGVGPDGWDNIAFLAQRHKGVCPAYGLHPMLADLYGDALRERLADFARSAIAIGETGLDYTLAGVSRESQVAALRGQLRLAVQAGLPVLLHCRKAFRDLIDIVREEGVQRVGGVMHAFSGSPEIAEECTRLGLFVSVSGTITYRNAVRPVDVARKISLDYLMLETDAPDMTPEPYRGRVNEPAYLVEIARKVSEVKGVALEEVAAVTTSNAERLFGCGLKLFANKR